ncbi:MAG: DUF1997 domain-containing protein [Chloroflexales bacterium]|nr:DUF1997 domain-containing protein [Chloroflexales bacterium]
MTVSRRIRTPVLQVRGRYIDLGGQAIHLFRFDAPVAIAYEYFCDVPSIFRLLPDSLDCYSYGPDRYRLIVGATDGHGHNMAAVFDLRAHHEPGYAIRLLPANDGPAYDLNGVIFPGTLTAEAVFQPEEDGTTVEYLVDIDLSIPVPSFLNLMPTPFLQALGERTMEYKMNQMVGGFTRGITADFHAWAGAGA